MITNGVAVHGDPVIWNYDDPVEYAAYQLNHSIFGVPQISLKLCDITESHRRMLMHYLRYFKENRDVLLFGKMKAEGFEQNYTVLSAVGKEKCITVLYAKNLISLSDIDPANSDVINATSNREIWLCVESDQEIYVKITDCKGDVVEEAQKVLSSGIHLFSVPISGFLHLKKMKN